ncbi:MAG: LVIVD repeat-containing protein [Candidatus Hodarchaeota archaeon]
MIVKKEFILLLNIILMFSVTTFSVTCSNGSNNQIELTKLGQAPTGGDAYDVWVNEERDLAYVTCGYHGFRIFDMSSPSNPVELSHVAETPAIINTGHSTGYAHQLLYHNEIVYVGDGAAGLAIINCSNSRDPYIITHYTRGYGWDIQIIDNIAFVASGYNNLGSPGVMILNITDPSNPILLRNYHTVIGITDVEVAGNYCYLASYSYLGSNSGLQILDISNYSNPIALGQYIGPSNSYAVDVEISGNLAYLSFWEEGLKILDISDPTNITVISEFNDNDISEFAFLDLNEEYVYLATMADGVVVLDVSDPYLPVERCKYNDTGKAYGIFVRDDFIFVADQSEGLKILKMELLSSETDTVSAKSFQLYLTILVLVVFGIRKRKSILRKKS